MRKHEDPAEKDANKAGKGGRSGPLKDPTKNGKDGKHGGGKK